MWAGADWTWHKPVMRNDEITTEAWLKDLIEHQTKFAGRAVQQIYHVRFFNQHGDLVAEADSWCFRTDRDTAREEGTKYTALKEKPVRRYTEAELADCYRHYHDETIRGAEPRYWESVQVGDALPTMVKGPMTVTGLYRLRARLGRPLHPRQQTRLEANPLPSWAWHPQPLQHPRLPGTRALGTGVRIDGRRARRLRLRARTLLLADASDHELDGRRRFPAPRHQQNPPP